MWGEKLRKDVGEDMQRPPAQSGKTRKCKKET